MLTTALAVTGGLVGLLMSADRFVAGAAATAKLLGTPPLLIGLTVVSIGTSAPELMVSASAALRGSGEIAIGNAIGSNLANIGLVLGITAMIAPIPVNSSVRRRELPLLILVTAGAALLFVDTILGRLDGLIMLTGLAVCLVLLARPNGALAESEPIELPEMSLPVAIFTLLLGLILLVASAEILVWGAVHLALSLGISELVIGLTVIAIGTSLPELAASGICAWKGHHDIAMGNILGSNFFNLLGVTSIAALIDPLVLRPEVLYRDYAAMALLTLFLAAIIALLTRRTANTGNPMRVGRRAGIALLIYYWGYYYFLFPSLNP